MAILVSGGAGYIGSHTCVELLAAGYDIVVADNYYNSCPEALARVKKIAGKDFRFVEADMTDKAAVEKIFAENEDIDCVIQFAAYKAVGEKEALLIPSSRLITSGDALSLNGRTPSNSSIAQNRNCGSCPPETR